MVVDKGKKSKVAEDSDNIDGELVLSIENLQEVQDELEKVIFSTPFSILVRACVFVCVAASCMLCVFMSLWLFWWPIIVDFWLC